MFADGSAITGWWGGSTRVSGLTYRKPTYETDNTRCSVVCGTRNGLVHECYLGHGFAARLDIASSPCLLQLDVDWYPLEGIALSVGFDPLRGRWSWAWKFIM
ncbi:MAG TPA: hypothetical protein VH682_02560 [Gemmataceae bacterium]